MNLLFIYFALILLLILFSLLVISSFWRYRFQGDRTALVISLFTVAFVLIIGSTIFLLKPGSLTNGSGQNTTLDGF